MDYHNCETESAGARRDHPDITAALCTGYPWGAALENEDTDENRREFAAEHVALFLDFVLAGDPAILDGFIGHYGWKYRSWLN